MQIKPSMVGSTATIRAKIVALTTGYGVLIDSPEGHIRIPSSLIEETDIQEIVEGSPVESTLASHKGIRGIVKAIDGDQAWVQWAGRLQNRTESLAQLRLAIISPT